MAKTTCINYALDLMQEHEYYRIDNIIIDPDEKSKIENLFNFFVFYKSGGENYLCIMNKDKLLEFVNTNFLEDEE